MPKKIIFNINNTLIPWSDKYYDTLSDTFNEQYVTYNENLIRKLIDGLKVYELNYNTYDVKTMKLFLEYYIGTTLPSNFIENWLKKTNDCCITKNEIITTLEYLNKKYELVVLTNWFTECQKERLSKSQILKYFKEVIGTDKVFNKPNKEAFIKACGDYEIDECIMVGSDIEKDILGAQRLGINTILYDYNNKHENYDKIKIKKFEELKEML